MTLQQKWKDILKWCGFRKFTSEDARKVGGYSAWWIDKWALQKSNGKFKYFQDGLPPPDLNNIFKWAVPKIKAKIDLESIEFKWEDNKSIVFLNYWLHSGNEEANNYLYSYDGRGQDDAKALISAIWGVVKDG